MEYVDVPPGHPRAESLRIRGKLIKHFKEGVVVAAGLIAHGRGEAFDYLLGERTTEPALKAIEAAAATLLIAKRPVISVNGNTTALALEEVVELWLELNNARIEVNLFHRSFERELAIERLLKEAGVKEVLGVGDAASASIPGVLSERRRVDPRGIFIADAVLIPLEDGDRAEALAKMGKTVIAIDLNPLSRTARSASITIVDNVVRAMPKLVKAVKKLKGSSYEELRRISFEFDNRRNLAEALRLINNRLLELAAKGVALEL